MRKLTALFLLIVVFFPLAFAAMTLTAIRPRVLDRGFYERIVNDERLYEAVLTDDLPRRFNRDAFTEVEQLPLESLRIALRDVLTADYLRTQSLSVINQVFDYLDGRERNFQLSLDIRPVKAALAGENSSRFASALASALPDCEAGQSPVAAGGNLTRCIVGESNVDAAAEQIAVALPNVLADMPDQIVLNDGSFYIRMNWYDYNWLLGTSVQTGLDIAVITMLMLSVAVGAVGAYLGGDDLRGRLKWFSSALFLPASLFLLAGLLLTSPNLLDPISRSIASFRYSEAYHEAVISMLVQVIQQVGNGILLAGIITSLVALGLLVLGLTTSAPGKQKPRMVKVPVRDT